MNPRDQNEFNQIEAELNSGEMAPRFTTADQEIYPNWWDSVLAYDIPLKVNPTLNKTQKKYLKRFVKFALDKMNLDLADSVLRQDAREKLELNDGYTIYLDGDDFITGQDLQSDRSKILKSLWKRLKKCTWITRLTIKNFNLDKLPKNVDILSKLVTLNISGNNLKSLPESLEKLINLRSLNLSHNPFAEIPRVVRYINSL